MATFQRLSVVGEVRNRHSNRLSRLRVAVLATALTLGMCFTSVEAQTSGYIQSIGTACQGASSVLPALTATGSLGPGKTVTFSVTGPANQVGVIVLGDKRGIYQVSPGCTLEVLIDPAWGPFYIFFNLGTTGSVTIPLPLPSTLPSIVGQHLYAQAVIHDSATPARDIVSNGLDLTGNVRVFLSNGSGGGSWTSTSTWTQVDGGISGMGIPGIDTDYDFVVIRDGDTVVQTAPMPKTLGLYLLEQGATHRFDQTADIASLVVEAMGKLDIRGVGAPGGNLHEEYRLTVRNAADVLAASGVMIERKYDANFCTLINEAPALFDGLSCTEDPGRQPPGGNDFEQTKTHKSLATIAVDNNRSVLTKPDDYAVVQLGMPAGVDTRFTKAGSNRSIVEWVIEGVIQEDDLFPTIRVLRHFLDPLTEKGLFGKTASDIWGKKHGSNDWSFDKARQHNYLALTAGGKAARDAAWADTFRAIGQVMHLIQDLGAAPHVRNDPHPVYRAIEDFAEVNFGTPLAMTTLAKINKNAGAKPPRYTFFGKVPEFAWLRDFWDQNQLKKGAVFAGFVGDPGLAELINANFWSLDTVLDPAYVHPAIIETNLVALFPAPPGTRIFYGSTDYVPTPMGGGWLPVSKIAGAGGIPLTTLAGAKNFGKNSFYSFFSSWLPVGTPKNRVGVSIYNAKLVGPGSVLTNYMVELLPRAIGYSTGFLNHYFRGKVDVRLRWSHKNQEFEIIINNVSSETIGQGSWQLFQDDAFGNRSAVTGATFTYPGTLAPNRTFKGKFKPHLTKKGRYTLVFKGTLGLEVGTAVIGKVFDAIRVEATWDPWADADVYLREFNNTLVYDANTRGVYAEHDVDEPGGKGPEGITVSRLIPGRLQFMVNYGEDHTLERRHNGSHCYYLPTPVYAWDKVGSPCFTQTDLKITVRTYHNCLTPLLTIVRTLKLPDRSVVPQFNRPLGPIGDSWYVTQIVTVDANGVITFSKG